MAVISLVIGGAGLSIFAYQKQLIKQDGERQLAVIAALKVKQITNWLDERKGDALALGGQSHIAGLMGEHRKTGALTETKKQWLRARLKTIQKAYHYDSVCLLDSDGKEFLSSSDTLKPAHHDAGLVRAAIHEKKTQISELHLTEGGKPELDLVAPLVAGEMEPRSISGLLQLRIDLNQFLFPLLQSWPVPSNTAETLLIRREGNSVLFLNELRHLPDSAMKLSRPLVHSLPAARALQGEKGTIHGLDYRGKPVVAHAQPVPGTAWAIIAKIDEDEMYAPIRRVGFYVALAAILLTIFTNAALFFWWRQRRAEFTAKQVEARLEKEVLARHFDYLSKYANDIIVLTDRDGLIIEANDQALETYGYPREEFVGTHAPAYRAKETRDKFSADWQRLHEKGCVLYETLHQHRDGTVFPVEISLREIEIEGQVFVQAITRDITERKQAEQALAESARFANATIDALSAHLCVLDENGVIVAVNQAWRDFAQENHGASSSAYLGANYLAVCETAAGASSEGAAEFAEGVRAVMHGDITEYFQEYPCHSPDEQRWFSARVSRFGGDGPLRVVAVHENITARKLAEEALLRYQEHLEDAVAARTAALRESEERTRLILESSGEGIFGVDLEGRITFVNPAARKILGYTEEELLGADSHATFHHTRLDGVPYPANECPRNKAYLEGVASQVCDEVFWSRNGLAIPVEYVATPLCKDNALIGAVINFRDISERKAAEAKLRSREHFLRMITDAVPGMVGYWDSDLKNRFANKAYLEWFGKQPEEMLGMPLVEMLGEDLLRKNEPFIRGVLQGVEQHFEHTIVKVSGEAGYVWVHFIPDKADGMVRGFFVLAADVTELKRAQMALEHTNQALQVRSEEAEAASRAKGAFLANMSHELRTPLHAVIGFSRLMSNDPVISAPQKRNLEIIHHAGNHLLTLIDEILEYSKIESGYLRVATVNTHLDSLLRELTGMLEAHAKEAGLTLTLETSGLPACIGIDAHKLRQVLINLLTNAIKYTKEGGVILKVSGKQKEDKQVELDFAVSDTGIGIASESLESIFEPFIQTAPSGRQSGTGLGLSISRQYVRLMGGELTVTSVLDKGSVFRFMLKVPRIDTLEGAVQLPPYDSGPPKNLFPWRILLVDDDGDGREEFRKMLERSGYTVMEAENATEAENCLGVFQPELVFMDWQMPGINGVEASRRIRARTDITQPVIVMLTAYSFEENRNAAVSAGIDDFVSKPVTKETVQAILKHWLNNKSQSHFPQRHISPAKEREPGKLDTLPADVRKRLSQAVIELNPEKIAAAIASIEAIQPETYHHLKALADALQYARIGRLLGIDGFEDM